MEQRTKEVVKINEYKKIYLWRNSLSEGDNARIVEPAEGDEEITHLCEFMPRYHVVDEVLRGKWAGADDGKEFGMLQGASDH